MKRPFIVFLVEHKDRELFLVTQLAKILAPHARVKVLSIPFHVWQLCSLPAPDVLVVPYALSGSEWPHSFLRDLYGSSVTILNLSWEQHLNKINFGFKCPKDEFAQKHVHHIAWYDGFKQFLMQHHVPDDHICLAEDPNVALLAMSEDERAATAKTLKTDLSIPEHHKLMFYPLCFSWAWYSDAEVETRIERGYPREDAYLYRETSVAHCRAMLQAISACDMPNVTHVVRPHPSVSERDYQLFWQDVAGGVPKSVLISKAYSVREWLALADGVVTSWSSVAFHAKQLGIPSWLYHPTPLPEIMHVGWQHELPVITTPNDLKIAVKATDLNPVRKAVSGNYITRVSEYVLSLSEQRSPKKQRLSPKMIVRLGRYRLRAFLAKLGLSRFNVLLYDDFNPLSMG